MNKTETASLRHTYSQFFQMAYSYWRQISAKNYLRQKWLKSFGRCRNRASARNCARSRTLRCHHCKASNSCLVNNATYAGTTCSCEVHTVRILHKKLELKVALQSAAISLGKQKWSQSYSSSDTAQCHASLSYKKSMLWTAILCKSFAEMLL